MSHSADCPFRAAFVAAAAFLPHADPGGDSDDVLAEYGFRQGTEFLMGRALIWGGLAGSFQDGDDLRSACEFLAGWCESWSGSMEESGRGAALAAARAALETAISPVVAVAWNRGWRAASESLVPGAAPFRPAAVLVAESGFSGPAAAAFLAGFRRCAGGPVEIDPVSGVARRVPAR